MSGLDADAFGQGFTQGLSAIDEHNLRQAQEAEIGQRGDYYKQMANFRQSEVNSQLSDEQWRRQQVQRQQDQQDAQHATLGAINYITEAARQRGVSPEEFTSLDPATGQYKYLTPEDLHAVQTFMNPLVQQTPYAQRPDRLFDSTAVNAANAGQALHANPQTQFTPTEQAAQADALFPEVHQHVGQPDYHDGDAQVIGRRVVAVAGTPQAPTGAVPDPSARSWPQGVTLAVQTTAQNPDGSLYQHVEPHHDAEDPEQVKVIPPDAYNQRLSGLSLLLGGLHQAGAASGIPNLLPVLHAAYLTSGGDENDIKAPQATTHIINLGDRQKAVAFDAQGNVVRSTDLGPVQKDAAPSELEKNWNFLKNRAGMSDTDIRNYLIGSPKAPHVAAADLNDGLKALDDRVLADNGVVFDQGQKQYQRGQDASGKGVAMSPAELAQVNAERAQVRQEATDAALSGDTRFADTAWNAYQARKGGIAPPAGGPHDPYVPGKMYQGKDGRIAPYLGDGKWGKPIGAPRGAIPTPSLQGAQ